MSASSTGTVLSRKTSGRGASAERLGRDENDFGIGSTSARDEADDDEEEGGAWGGDDGGVDDAGQEERGTTLTDRFSE